MSLKKALKSVIAAKFTEYCKHSTLHGVFYFSDRSRWWVHVIWALILGCSMSLCGFLGHMIWDKFAIDPTLTVVESTHHSVSNIPFPAVAVCDTEIVHKPNTVNITNLFLLRGYNSSEVDEFYMSFSDMKTKDYIPQPYIKKMHFLLEDLGYSFEVLLEMFKKPCSELIAECTWRSKYYNCSDMFRPVYTIAGHCCQFDIPYFRSNVGSDINYISGVEESEALDIVVNLQKKTLDGNITESYTSLYVFDEKDKITLMDYPITVTADSYFEVNVYVWAIDSSDNVKALSLDSRKCILDTDKGIGAGFYQGCLTRLILQRVVNHCRCLPFDITAKDLGTEDYKACSWERLICIYGTIDKVQEDSNYLSSQHQCYQRCDYVQYSTEVEYVNNHRQLHSLLKAHSRVAVHFSLTTCMKYRREVLYTWDQMLANLGGIFGLCLGGSIISAIELLWFLIGLFFSIIAVLRNKSVAPKDNKIITVSEKYTVEKIPRKPIGFLKYKYMN